MTRNDAILEMINIWIYCKDRIIASRIYAVLGEMGLIDVRDKDSVLALLLKMQEEGFS